LLTAPDDREEYGEERLITTGQLGSAVIVVVVHTVRNERIRLISARKANRNERQAYHDYLEKALERD
jgi:uncharacterized DUF497 family protein